MSRNFEAVEERKATCVISSVINQDNVFSIHLVTLRQQIADWLPLEAGREVAHS